MFGARRPVRFGQDFARDFAQDFPQDFPQRLAMLEGDTPRWRATLSPVGPSGPSRALGFLREAAHLQHQTTADPAPHRIRVAERWLIWLFDNWIGE